MARHSYPVLMQTSPAADMPSARTPGPAAAARWFDLPFITLRLLWAHWPELLCWLFLQLLAYQLLLDLSVWLGRANPPLGFLGLSLLVVAQLLCTIAMFQALRPSMPGLARAVAESGNGGLVPQRWAPSRRLTEAIAIALLPFFAYYAAWGMLGNVLRAYVLDFRREAVGGNPLSLLSASGLWLSIAATWALRRFSLWRHDKTRSALWSVMATVCEAYWVFLGLFAISRWTGQAWGWWDDRVVVVAWYDWWDGPRSWYGLLPILKDWLGPPLALLHDAAWIASLPLLWLAITAVIYGHDLRDPSLLAHRRLEPWQRRYAGLPSLARVAADKWSAGWRKKGVPILNSLRLILRAGLRPAVMLCFCYIALDFLCSHVFRLVVWLIGPQEFAVWNLLTPALDVLVGGPIPLAPTLIKEPLRICLLAAAVELTLRRLWPAPAAAVPADGAAAPVSA